MEKTHYARARLFANVITFIGWLLICESNAEVLTSTSRFGDSNIFL